MRWGRDGSADGAPEGGTPSPTASPRPAALSRLIPVAAALLGTACSGGDGPGESPTSPPSEGPPRTYAVGWAPNPPRASQASLFATVEAMAEVSEVTIVQQAVPWPELLSGASIDELVAERVALTDFLRAHGLEIVFLVDPLDGLERTREPPELVEAGRSLLEPEIRALHEAWVLAVAREVRPVWMGLASEINTLAARGDEALYVELRDLVNELAPRVREASPGTEVFVSFQMEDARGLFGLPSRVDHFEIIDDFDVDALGLSSYPVFVFETPAGVPDDHFARFDAATDLPLLFVEGGWSSEDTEILRATPEEQAAFFRRYEELLDGVAAELWVMLTFTDIDIESLVAGGHLPAERAAALAHFARMGIVDVDFRPKPAHGVWEEIFSRPRR